MFSDIAQYFIGLLKSLKVIYNSSSNFRVAPTKLTKILFRFPIIILLTSLTNYIQGYNFCNSAFFFKDYVSPFHYFRESSNRKRIVLDRKIQLTNGFSCRYSNDNPEQKLLFPLSIICCLKVNLKASHCIEVASPVDAPFVCS